MNPRLAVYPGRFDPMTLGHLDIITRASALFDRCIILVAASKNGLWSTTQRADKVRESVAHLANVQVEVFDGLLVQAMQQRQAKVVVRGLRNSDDFYDEHRMSVMNRQLSEASIDTLFLLSSPEVATISATLVREIVAKKGSVEAFVPPPVWQALQESYGA